MLVIWNIDASNNLFIKISMWLGSSGYLDETPSKSHMQVAASCK